MKTQNQAQDTLLQIANYFDDEYISENKKINPNSKELKKLTQSFNEIPSFKSYQLTHNDIILISISWMSHVNSQHSRVEPIELLTHIFCDKSECVKQLDIIINLLQTQIHHLKQK